MIQALCCDKCCFLYDRYIRVLLLSLGPVVSRNVRFNFIGRRLKIYFEKLKIHFLYEIDDFVDTHLQSCVRDNPFPRTTVCVSSLRIYVAETQATVGGSPFVPFISVARGSLARATPLFVCNLTFSSCCTLTKSIRNDAKVI